MKILKYARRKNRKIKFSEDKYIEKYYIQDGIAVIPLEIENEKELYMKHDYKQMELSDEVCAYIEEIAYMVPINTNINIEIHCPRLTKFKQEKVKKAIKNNFGIEIDDIDYDIRSQNKKSLVLLFFGLLLLFLNIIFDKDMGSILSNLLCVVWWVAIWDLIEIQIFDKTENIEKRLNYLQLYDSQITFVFNEDEEEKEEL